MREPHPQVFDAHLDPVVRELVGDAAPAGVDPADEMYLIRARIGLQNAGLEGRVHAIFLRQLGRQRYYFNHVWWPGLAYVGLTFLPTRTSYGWMSWAVLLLVLVILGKSVRTARRAQLALDEAEEKVRRHAVDDAA